MSLGIGISGGQAYVINHETKRKRKLGKKNTILAASDGVFAVLGDKDENMRIYWAQNLRPIQKTKVKGLESLNIVEGKLSIGLPNRRIDTVDLETKVPRKKNPHARLTDLFT